MVEEVYIYLSFNLSLHMCVCVCVRVCVRVQLLSVSEDGTASVWKLTGSRTPKVVQHCPHKWYCMTSSYVMLIVSVLVGIRPPPFSLPKVDRVS